MSSAQVNPSVLAWSRQRAGLSEYDIARGLPVKPEKVFAWEGGESRPTFRQAQKWATIAHIPFGLLFLREPPHEDIPLPDLRTIGGIGPSTPSLNLLDTVKDVLRKHNWYVEYMTEQHRQPLSFIGAFTTNSSVSDVVAHMRQTLGVVDDGARPTNDEYIRLLVHAAEAVGILVMRSGIVGANTHRKLDVGEFRGFAISDPLAPLIFINSADAPTARLFTLIHELTHIWIGSSGVSNNAVNAGRIEEVFCNAVAGEFLAPEAALRSEWRNDIPWNDNVVIAAAKFRVSKLVAARRACDLGLVDRAAYHAFYLAELNAFRNQEKNGGSFYTNANAKNSNRFSKAVLAETLSGRMLLRDAAKLLGIQPSKIKTYAANLGE